MKKVRFINNSRKVLDALKQKAKEARIEAAEEIGNIAQANAPVKTGELRDSKTIEHGEEVSRVSFTAPHSRIVEFGGSRQSANPFFLNAFMQGKKILTQKLKEKLK